MEPGDESLRATPRLRGGARAPVPAQLGPYRIVRHVGSGGMGTVYEAVDGARGARVAIKTLSALAPGALFRFKQEYRHLADLTHRNLATLYELMAIDGTWLLTMEFVDGVDLLDYVWGGSEPPAGPGLLADVEHRLRAALHQLASGIEALHAARLLHLDVKPSNVLVDASGRVVVLDFGLVQSIERAVGEPAAARGDAELAGTPLYVSPEQVLGSRAGPASDWYAVGVVLYEALTGRPPFRGSPVSVMMARTVGEVPDPQAQRAELPPDLAALCRGLLAQDPDVRATGREIRACCEGASSAVRSSGRHRTVQPLVGRGDELAALYRLCEAGAPVAPLCVFVEGASGVGKTAVAGALLARFEAEGALVLRGRCYERESVPFKGFDAVIDALCRWLEDLPDHELQALIDDDIHHTAQIFSVLRDLPGVAASRRPASETLEPAQRLARAFAGLKRLLGQLARRHRVVVFLDDLHWADADSAHLLRQLLVPPDPPPVLVLGAYRDDEAAYSPFLRELRAHQDAPAAEFRAHTLAIAPLPPADAEQLARLCLPADCDADRVSAVARDTAGVPFFIEAIARYTGAGAGAAGALPSLDRLIDTQLAEMTAGARQLLQVIAIAARPIEQDLAVAAAALSDHDHDHADEQTDEQAAIAQLRSARLVRTRGARGGELVEPYHDRIRQIVTTSLGAADRAGAHRRLATVLEAGQRGPAEALAFHLHGAGQLRQAAEYAERAAREAAAALAFQRAAELFADALRWGDATPDRTRELQIERARALFNAGRCGDAARVYLDAAHGAAPDERRELRRRAAEAFLYGGHVDEGMAVARVLLAEIGRKFPGSERRVMVNLVAQLGYLRVRGIDFAPRPAHALTADQRFDIDLCWSLGKGLGNVLPLEGTYFMVAALTGALRLGEPTRIGRSLAFVGGAVLSQSGIGKRYLERAEALGRELGDPYLAGLPLILRGLIHLVHTARCAPAIELADRGIAILRASSTGISWEHSLATGIAHKALEGMGELIEIRRRAVAWRRESEDRGDRFAQIMAGLFEVLTLIGRGEIAAARQLDHHLLRGWSTSGYTAQHFHSLILRTYCELYDGQHDAAWQVFQRELPRLERAYYERIPLARVPIYYLHACLLIDRAHERRGERATLLRAAGKIGARLARERQRVDGPVHARLIAAAIAAAQGDHRRARALLADCYQAYRQIDMRLTAACVERRLGELTGDTNLVRAGDAECRRLGVAEPARWADAYVPRLVPGGPRT